MLENAEILWGVAIPAAIGLVALLASLRSVRRDLASDAWGPALAVAGGFVASFLGIAVGGLPRRFPPVDASQWLIYLAALVVPISVALTFVRRRAWVVTAVAATLLGAATTWLLVRGAYAIPEAQRAVWVAVGTAIVVAWWAGVEALAHRVRGATVPLVLALAAMVACMVLINGHTRTLGLVGAGLVTPLAALAVLGVWYRNLSLTRGAVLAAGVALTGLLLSGHLFADVTRRDALLVLAAPLAAWLGEVPLPRAWPERRRRAVRFAIRLAAALAVLAVPGIPAARGLQQTLQEQTESFLY